MGFADAGTLSHTGMAMVTLAPVRATLAPVALFALGALALRGQQTIATPAAVGSRYSVPVPVSAAPGQILTFILQGLGTGITQPIEAQGGASLPTTLGGISAVLTEKGLEVTATDAVPLLEVRPLSTLSGGNAGTKLVAATVQMPLELLPFNPHAPGLPAFGTLEFADTNLPAGSQGAAVELYPVNDRVHILTNCDTVTGSGILAPQQQFTGIPCPGLVTHGDGSPVTASKPAQPGEELVLYAVGLGQTNPPQQTGQPASSAAPTVTPMTLDFNYRSNALATKPGPSAPPAPYAGATPGFAGLYQVNFTVPPVPSGTPACYVNPGLVIPPNSNLVYSNLTVSVGGSTSFDGTGICVAVPGS